jgi:hypothetical protein
MSMNPNRVLRVITILCFLFISAAVIIASSSVATGYELSIYTETPATVWVLLFTCVSGGTLLICHYAITGKEVNHLGLVIGPLGLANLTVLLLPTLRGYYLYASPDSLAHMGMGLDITLTGHPESMNVYPAIHILIAQLCQICDIHPTLVGRLLPIFLNTVFAVVWMYLVGRATLPERGQALLVFAFASGFLLNSLHTMIYAHVLSLFFVLLVLYFQLDGSMKAQLAGRISLIIILLFIPYSHPAPAVVVVFFLLAVELSGVLYRRPTRWSVVRRISITLPLISLITFFTWISSFAIFGHKVSVLWSNLREPLAAPHVQTLENAMGEISTLSALVAFMRMYGDTVICFLLAGIGTLIVTRQMWKMKQNVKNLWALTAVCLLAMPLELLIFAGSRSQTIGRVINLSFAIFLSPILAGYALHQLLRRARKATAIAVSSVILLSFWVIGALGIYHSPWIWQPSWQITHEDVQGIEWFLQNKDNDISFSAMGYPHGVPYVVLGHRSATVREDLTPPVLQMLRDPELVLPTGFGYDRLETLGESLDQDRYLLIARRFQIATADPRLRSEGLTVIPLFWPGFRPADFERLDQDPSASKLYSNGEFDVWHVNAMPRGD